MEDSVRMSMKGIRMGRGDGAVPFPYFTNTCFSVGILSCICRENQVKGAFCFNEKCTPQVHVFYLQLVAVFGKVMLPLRRCDLTGGSMSLGWALRLHNLAPFPVYSLLPARMQTDLESLRFLLPHLASMPLHHDGLLSNWNWKPKLTLSSIDYF